MDINLVIVGKDGWMVDDLLKKMECHSEVGKHLFLLRDVTDGYLDKIYASCACLIAANEGEGCRSSQT